jgi:glycogen debranching enzyme
MRKIILTTASYQDRNSGRIPNKIPEFKNEYEELSRKKKLHNVFYNCVDATLLYVNVAEKFVRTTNDLSLANSISPSFVNILECFERGNKDAVDGPPVIDPETGLLLCMPSHTWTDSQCTLTVGSKCISSYPLRVPTEWVEQDKSADEIFRSLHCPKFYLPEVNAQWIKALESFVEFFNAIRKDGSAEDSGRYLWALTRSSALLNKAKANFKTVFWNKQKGFVYNIVSDNFQRKDPTEGSPAIVALALMGDLFNQRELNQAWTVIQNTLLVKRSPVAFQVGATSFGVLAKHSRERIYFDDRQYHEAVVWPRDTPYLIKFLDQLKMRDEVGSILINNLDHQIAEAALFFNNELFSLADGKNPYPNGCSSNPIPIKNPIQWWSQWVDPYLSFYGL